MMTSFFVTMSQVMRPAMGLLLFLVWWPHRRSGMVSSVPWIILYLAFANLMRWGNVLASGWMMRGRENAERLTSASYDFLVFISFLNQGRYLLIAVMVAINVAFLLQFTGPVNRFQSFLARQQRFQHALGALLVVTMVLPVLVGWLLSR